jgi:hypothetical protein
MASGCITPVTNYTSGSQITGLTAGTTYYVTITAVGPAGYASNVTAVSAGTKATTQLNAPGKPTLASGTSTTSGSLAVTFAASSNAAAGQTYTALACTNVGMTSGCVGPAAIATGGQITGLTAGTGYYVTVTAVASTGYLASSASTASSVGTATEQLNTPTITSFTAYNTTTMIINTSSSNQPAGQTFTVKACKNVGMTGPCVTSTTYTSGAQLGGFAASTSYWVEVTANASTGYLVSTVSTVDGPVTS